MGGRMTYQYMRVKGCQYVSMYRVPRRYYALKMDVGEVTEEGGRMGHWKKDRALKQRWNMESG